MWKRKSQPETFPPKSAQLNPILRPRTEIEVLFFQVPLPQLCAHILAEGSCPDQRCGVLPALVILKSERNNSRPKPSSECLLIIPQSRGIGWRRPVQHTKFSRGRTYGNLNIRQRVCSHILSQH